MRGVREDGRVARGEFGHRAEGNRCATTGNGIRRPSSPPAPQMNSRLDFLANCLPLHPRFFQTHIPLMRLGAESTASLSFLPKGISMSNLRFFLILSLLANALLVFLFITDGGSA